MRVLALLVLTASIVAAALVLTAPAKAGWSGPQSFDSGHSPQVRAGFVGYAKGEALDPSHLLVTTGNEPIRRVRVPRAGRVVAFDVDGRGRLVALREAGRRVVALEGGRWRRISPAGATAVDARLAVAASGAAVATWLQYAGRRIFVHAAIRPRGARRFGPPQRISGATRRSPQPGSVAVDDAGNAVVAFVERRDLFLWRSGRPAVRIHDATGTTAGAFASVAAIRGQTALVGFTRLEDAEPPRYRATAATLVGAAPPVVETVATDVSALDLAADVSSAAAPVLLTTPIGPPHAIDLNLRTTAWERSVRVPATEAPSTPALQEGAIAWTEGTSGFAWFGGQTLSLGRAFSPDVAVAGDQALVAWDQGPRRPLRVATFTP